IAGGARVGVLGGRLGEDDVLLVCVARMLGSAVLAGTSESLLRPRPRPVHEEEAAARRSAALDGARLVWRSPYLLLIVGVVVAYEFAAAMTDFVVSVVFERTYTDQDILAQMFGRVGWIVSGVALLSQLVIVPLLLPRKRAALLVPPL